MAPIPGFLKIILISWDLQLDLHPTKRKEHLKTDVGMDKKMELRVSYIAI